MSVVRSLLRKFSPHHAIRVNSTYVQGDQKIDRQLVINAHRAGRKSDEIQKMFSISQSTVSRILIAAGERNKKISKFVNKEVALNMYEGGKTLQQIADYFQVSNTTVYYLLTGNHRYEEAKSLRGHKTIEPCFDVVEAWSMYQNGCGLNKIGEYFVVPSEMVRQTFLRYYYSEYQTIANDRRKSGISRVEIDPEKALDMYINRRMSLKKTSEFFGVKVNSIRNSLWHFPEFHEAKAARGRAVNPLIIKVSRRPGPPPRVDHNEGWELYKAGLTIEQIAEYLKCSSAAVSKFLRNEHGEEYTALAKVRTPCWQMKDRQFSRDEAFTLFKSGLSTISIGQQLNVTPSAIHKALRDDVSYAVEYNKLRKYRVRKSKSYIHRKLSADAVRSIRLDTRDHGSIAKEYNVSNGTIGKIKRRERYKDVE
jgi:DNA-binding CsgD family transcriptional regulator